MSKSNVVNNVQNLVKKIAHHTAVKNANTACGWWQYQPKQPESIKKLRKF